MPRLIEAEARITAVDATGATFEKIAAKVRGLASNMKALGNVATSGIGNANRSIGQLQTVMSTLAPIAASGAAFEGIRGVQDLIHETVKAAAARAHETARMAAAGFTDQEMAEAGKISQEVSEKNRALSTTTVMHSLRNLRSIIGTFDEAGKLIEPIAQLRLVTLAAHPERKEELEASFDKLEKSEEMVGATQDPARFRADMDLVAKGMNLYGDTLRPDDYYDFAKYSRQAGQGYSDRFRLGVGPTLMQEMAGKSAGEALSSFYQQFVAGKMPEYAAQLMGKYGLIGDRRKVEYNKSGMIKRLEPGAILDHELAKEDPNRWLREVFLPHLAAHGARTKEQITDVVATMAGKRTTGQAMGIFATQQSRIDKDLANFDRAKGLDAAQMFMNKDPGMAWLGVTSQFENLLAIAGGPMAGPAAATFNEIADGIVKLENATKGHPETATAGLLATIGGGLYGTYRAAKWGLGRMFGAGGAPAEELSESAAARAAAVRLFGGSPVAASGGGWMSSVGLMLGGAQLMAQQSSDGGPTAYGARGTAGEGIGLPGLLNLAKKWPALGLAPAEVKGSADLNVNVQVEPSDSFISRIVSAIRNDINVFGGDLEPGSGVGTMGSTGLSMPPATPNP